MMMMISCMGTRDYGMFDEDFKTEIKGVLNESGYNKFSIDPFTDVNQLAKKYDFNCLNLGCGYYRQHSDSEYVIMSEVGDSLKAGVELINKLGVTKYVHKKTVVKPIVNETQKYGLSSQFDEFDEEPFVDEFDEIGTTVTEMVITMFIGGISEREICEEVSKYLRDTYEEYV